MEKQYPAKCLGFTDKKCNALLYEYKGQTYIISPNIYTSLAKQHKQEQQRINIAIEEETKAKEEYSKLSPKEKEEMKADYQLNKFFEEFDL